MTRYSLTANAQRDLREIRDYVYSEGGIRAARFVIARLVGAFRAIAKTPGLGHLREDLTTRPELRFWPVFSYLIVYRNDTQPLRVIAILHGKRDVESVLFTRR